jgi:two-component system NtrC family sensor kinase
MQTLSPRPAELPAGDFPYFRRLWNTIVSALIGAAFIPLILIGGGLLHYAGVSLRESTLQSLLREVEHHQKSVDRFLAERIGDLRLVTQVRDLASLTQPGAIEAALGFLHAHGPYFSDLGVIDDQGRHLAYAGPYDLIRENYAKTGWFDAVMTRDFYISDVFFGFRNSPHFIIAVKQMHENRFWILRATVNASFFDHLVGEITATGGGVSFLVNAKGLFQTSPTGTAQWMEPSDVAVPQRFAGVRTAEHNGHIRAMGWLENVPWLSVVQVDKREIFQPLRRMRLVGLLVFILGAALIVLTALLTTNHLVNRLEAKRRSIQLMGHHLRQANKMTLSLLLHKGFFQEINEALANIDSAATVIGEQVRQAAGAEAARSDLDENLGQIRSQILRSRETIHQLIAFSRPTVSVITDIDINQVLDGLIDLFHREILFKNVRVNKDFQEPPPVARGDPSQLEQVIQNLMFNALDAIGQAGAITLKTRIQGDLVHITVADDGPGIAAEVLEKLFHPPFTTRPGRLGLGLAICREILKKMGGDINVDSRPGKGAAFTVFFPIRFRP